MGRKKEDSEVSPETTLGETQQSQVPGESAIPGNGQGGPNAFDLSRPELTKAQEEDLPTIIEQQRRHELPLEEQAEGEHSHLPVFRDPVRAAALQRTVEKRKDGKGIPKQKA
jgi:hypothetical protein